MLTRQEITTKARKLVADHLDVDPAQVTPDAGFICDLGADSLDVVEISMLFEEEFDLEIPDDKAEEIKVFGDAVNLLASMLGVPA